MESAYELNLETSGAKQKVTPLIDEAVLQRIRIFQKALEEKKQKSLTYYQIHVFP